MIGPQIRRNWKLSCCQIQVGRICAFSLVARQYRNMIMFPNSNIPVNNPGVNVLRGAAMTWMMKTAGIELEGTWGPGHVLTNFGVKHDQKSKTNHCYTHITFRLLSRQVNSLAPSYVLLYFTSMHHSRIIDKAEPCCTLTSIENQPFWQDLSINKQ